MGTATYNVENCSCGMDHDSLKHIVAMKLLALSDACARGEHVTVLEVGEAVERAARAIGWVKTFREEEKEA